MTHGMTHADRRESVLARQRFLGVLAKRRPRRKAARPPPMRLPDGARAEYARALNQLVRELEGLVSAELGDASLEELVRQNQLGRNDASDLRLDDVWDELSEKLRRLRAAAARVFEDRRIQALGFRIGEAVSRHNKGEVMKQLSSAITIDVFGDEAPVRRQLQAFVADNVRLIKSIPEKALNEVEGVVLAGVRRGTVARDIATDIRDRFGVSRSRATLIARDQVGKFNGELTQLRHQEAGITEYIWRTSKDERVRASHRVLDGRRFKWSEPPEEGNPGESVQCRCTAEPVLDEFLLPEDRPLRPVTEMAPPPPSYAPPPPPPRPAPTLLPPTPSPILPAPLLLRVPTLPPPPPALPPIAPLVSTRPPAPLPTLRVVKAPTVKKVLPYDLDEGKARAKATGNTFKIIPISQILERAPWAPGKTTHISAGLMTGANFPAIRVSATAHGYDIVDGIHRAAAARAAGFTHIAAVVEGSIAAERKRVGKVRRRR